jgi:Flp pilus assembly pilin Flp
MNDIDTNTSSIERSSSRSEAGQALVEYALILACVSIMAAALTPIGQWVALRLTDLAVAV